MDERRGDAFRRRRVTFMIYGHKACTKRDVSLQFLCPFKFHEFLRRAVYGYLQCVVFLLFQVS